MSKPEGLKHVWHLLEMIYFDSDNVTHLKLTKNNVQKLVHM